jgi:hypothetical protein
MATYYWVGGAGTWNNTSTINWSTTSGGLLGAGPPTTSDNVIFDAASSASTYAITIDATAVCADLNAAAPASGTLTFNGSNGLNVSGSFIWGASNVIFNASGTITFNATTTGKIIDTNDYANFFPVTFNGVGGEWTLQSDFTSQSAVFLTNGSLKLNDKRLKMFNFSSNNANARGLDFGTTGKIELTRNTGDVWGCNNVLNFTFAGTSDVRLTNATSGTRNILHAISNGTYARAVSFTAEAGSGTVFFGGAGQFLNLSCTGFSGTVNGGSAATVYGNIILNSNITFALPTIYGVGDTSKTITSNGATFTGSINIWSAAQTVTFADAFIGGAVSLTSGTLVAGGSVSITSFTTVSGAAKTLTLGSSIWTVSGSGTAWNANVDVANLTVSASLGSINMSSASAKTFAGGAKTWPTLNQGGAGTLTLQQSNTFANITNTVQPATITFPASATTTVSALSVAGTAGNLITLNSSTAGVQATLSDSSGTNAVSFTSIKDNNAIGGATWLAYTDQSNIDAGNNDGWDFGISPVVGGAEYTYTIRSFTQPRRF